MDSSTGRNKNGTHVVWGCLAGAVSAAAAFFIGTLSTYALMAVYFNSVGTFSEVGPEIAIVVSPIVGLLAAVVTGILVGRGTYARLSDKR
jgi:hypothetical protein